MRMANEKTEFAKAADLLEPAIGEKTFFLKTLKKKVTIKKVNIGDIASIMTAAGKEKNDIAQYIYLCFKGLKNPSLSLDQCRKLPLKVLMELSVEIARFSELDKESMDSVRNLLTTRS